MGLREIRRHLRRERQSAIRRFRKQKRLNCLYEFCHLTEDGEEAAQFCFKNEDDDEYEYDEKSDAWGIVNSTRPR